MTMKANNRGRRVVSLKRRRRIDPGLAEGERVACSSSASPLLMILLFIATLSRESEATIGRKQRFAFLVSYPASRRHKVRTQQHPSVWPQRAASSSASSTFAAVGPSLQQQANGTMIVKVEGRGGQSQQQSRGEEEDNRPFEQRVERRRSARRMNHAFKYLYRHDDDNNSNSTASKRTTTDPLEYLIQEGGLTRDQVLEWNRSFPILLGLSVQEQLAPKMRFLKETLKITDPATIFALLPPSYFGMRLERTLAPRHAFLVWAGLPSGPALFQRRSGGNEATTSAENTKGTTTLCNFQDFTVACRMTKRFAALCESWRRSNIGQDDGYRGVFRGRKITAKDIEAFDAMFSRGLMAAVRDELIQVNNTWPIEQLSAATTLEASQVVKLLISHGANPRERDQRGATLMHWACGRGHWKAAEQLLLHSSNGDNNCLTIHAVAERDGATPLHWAAAGVSSRGFGVGGHVNVCQNLLDRVRAQPFRTRHQSVRDYVNCLTYDGNSPLMWAAWAGCLDTVKLLARHQADTDVRNRNGCTVAHWAASGGSLPVCQYLADTIKVDFSVPNDNGNTPLSHAVAFGRTDVVQWLLSLSREQEDKKDEMLAYSLAQDFVQWTDGTDSQRKKVQQLFEDDDWSSVGVL